MISERGIDPNPDKIEAILNMEPSKSYKELQHPSSCLKPIYYVSHLRHGLEESYPLINKFVLALVTSAWKLKAYFAADPIDVVTDQPIKRVLSNPTQTGRLTMWVVELSEFDITYALRTWIKAQALADFLIECTARNPLKESDSKSSPLELPQWSLYVDGASNPKAVGVGILIQGPKRASFE
ncbi:hypothetical protein LIER_05923 [Lithospermum erythrorhizon]|uniref:Reverse transcriptase RNase H-like domain-containing protein n=1 Tax=Lithospermum erythrorhizon TaxID=34254 RepID=A0AAV3P2L8_LITER